MNVSIGQIKLGQCHPAATASGALSSGYKTFAEVPADFGQLLGDLFTKNGYLWPDEMVAALEKKPFTKVDVERIRWWSPKFNCLGSEGIRDPDAPCELFTRDMSMPAMCKGDGHYLCRECTCRRRASEACQPPLKEPERRS